MFLRGKEIEHVLHIEEELLGVVFEGLQES